MADGVARPRKDVDIPALREVAKEMNGKLGHITNGDIRRWADQIEKALKGRKSE